MNADILSKSMKIHNEGGFNNIELEVVLRSMDNNLNYGFQLSSVFKN